VTARRDRRRERDEATRLRVDGASVDEIARRLGISRRSVLALLRPPATFRERACELCGAPFIPTNGRQRYCTPEHWQRATAPEPTPRECPHCGQLFLAPGRTGQRYCTPAHRREHARRTQAPRESLTDWRERVRRLEAEVARARAELAGREAA
jgi:hypothetical protein